VLALAFVFVLSSTSCTAFLKGFRAGMQGGNRGGKPSVAQPPAIEPAKVADPASAQDVIAKKAFDLVNASDFDAADKLASEARTKKARLPGGYWQIDSVYDGLTGFFAEYKGQRVTDEMWANKIELLKRWKEKNPASITARVALAETYIHYGFAARGNGVGDTVSPDGWEKFSERLDMAEEELKSAQKLETGCPRWYREVLSIGMFKGWSADEFNDVFNEAVAYEPNYLQTYLVKSENLTPKWNGGRGDWQKFVDSLPSKLATLKTDEADSIYLAVLVNKTKEWSQTTNWGMVSKERIKNGFAQLEKKYGVDNHRLNQYALLLTITGQSAAAKPIFERIGDNFDNDVWDPKMFAASKEVAEHGRPNIAQVNNKP
jgi:hypothetical protein